MVSKQNMKMIGLSLEIQRIKPLESMTISVINSVILFMPKTLRNGVE
ncbi:MAG: hypothetical protein IIB40_10125 [Candidatus Marinimicrobia bacterium]|nr:hypothetical protein [Candidatus Neomarinimicrobiota bacterium]